MSSTFGIQIAMGDQLYYVYCILLRLKTRKRKKKKERKNILS